jgi:hypothetical protein
MSVWDRRTQALATAGPSISARHLRRRPVRGSASNHR